MESLHEKTRTGFTKGSSYDKGRPSYTDESIEHIVSILNLDSLEDTGVQYDIVELGAGTGKFTEKIVGKLAKNVRYLATEPMDDFRRQISFKCPTIETEKCAANSIPLPDSSVKAVVAAQSFHWFATEESLAEIRRVLVAGGKLVLIWNQKDRSAPWVQKMEDVLSIYYSEDTPRAIRYKWKTLLDTHPGFADAQHKFLPGITFMGSSDFIVDHYCTISVINSLDDNTKKKARNKLQEVIDGEPSLVGTTAIILPMVTELYYCTKV